jgi:hypothetical protein
MNDPLLVRRFQCISDLACHLQSFVERNRTACDSGPSRILIATSRLSLTSRAR